MLSHNGRCCPTQAIDTVKDLRFQFVVEIFQRTSFMLLHTVMSIAYTSRKNEEIMSVAGHSRALTISLEQDRRYMKIFCPEDEDYYPLIYNLLT